MVYVVKNGHKIFLSCFIQMKKDSWSKTIGTSSNMQRPNYSLLNWPIGGGWRGAGYHSTDTDAAASNEWVSENEKWYVFSIGPGVENSAGEVEAGAQGVWSLVVGRNQKEDGRKLFELTMKDPV